MPDALGVDLILAGRAMEPELGAMLASVISPRGERILINNETSFEIVPVNALARASRDMAGTINQRVAATSNHVHPIAADRSMVPK